MSIWNRVKVATATLPPRIIVYGPPGMGKTTLASEFPNPIFIQVEDGTPGDLQLTTFGTITSFEDVLDALAALYQERHDFQTLVIDSMDKLEPLLWDAVCAENKWENIESPGYGKGYTTCDYKWRDLLSAFNILRSERGMNIVLLCHSDIERFDDPSSVSYSRYEMRLHKRARAILQDDVDTILLLKQDVAIKQEDKGFSKTRAVAEGGINRFIFTEGRPAFVAKNRYGLPPKIKYEKGKGYEALAPYFPAPVVNETETKAA